MMQKKLFFADHSGSGQIHARIWLPDEEPYLGILQVLHGMNEYAGRYQELASFLSSRGWVLAAADHLGHGESIPPGCCVGSLAERNGWQHMLEDIRSFRAILQHGFPGLPCFALGHSMGSFLLRELQLREPWAYAGIILSGTGSYGPRLCSLGLFLLRCLSLLKGKHGHSPFLHKAILSFCNYPFRKEGHPLAWISRDQELCCLHAADPLCSYYPDLDFYAELLRGLRHVERCERASHPCRELPILLLSGREDAVGAWGHGVSRVYRRLCSGGASVEMLLYPGGRHEMIHETNREEVFQDVLEWLNACLAAALSKKE
ncbi:MAG: alpha/beta fold hydrolase [Bacillota bacterium]|nr:alpha/beta fold hydrolase [Bacillota bacterium]